MATKATGARRPSKKPSKRGKPVLIYLDTALYARLDALKLGQTVTSLCRDLIIQGAEEEFARRIGRRLDLVSGGGQ